MLGVVVQDGVGGEHREISTLWGSNFNISSQTAPISTSVTVRSPQAFPQTPCLASPRRAAHRNLMKMGCEITI